MLRCAVDFAKAGERVTVIAHNTGDRCRIMLELQRIAPEQADAIEVKTVHAPGVSLYEHVMLGMPIYRGVGKGSMVLVDHHAIEQHFAPVLAALHRWDDDTLQRVREMIEHSEEGKEEGR